MSAVPHDACTFPDRFARRERREDGFTLVELMVTLLIIGILVSIALPTFLGARQRAQNRAAQSNLRNGLVAVKVFYTDRGTYVGFNTGCAAGAACAAGSRPDLIEPSLNWWGAGSPAVGQVRIGGAVPTATTIMLVTRSASLRYFCIKDVVNPLLPATTGTSYRSGALYTNVNTFALCSGTTW